MASPFFDVDPFTCTICLFESDCWPRDACTLRPCGHHFHLGCVSTWCDRESSCPNCKAAVTSILKGSRGAPRRSELPVKKRKQSGGDDEEDAAIAEALAEEEAEEAAAASGGGGADAYVRDGFVVGDSDVEFYDSDEERQRNVRPRLGRRRAAAAAAERLAARPAPPRRGGRLRRNPAADEPDSQESFPFSPASPRPPVEDVIVESDDSDDSDGGAGGDALSTSSSSSSAAPAAPAASPPWLRSRRRAATPPARITQSSEERSQPGGWPASATSGCTSPSESEASPRNFLRRFAYVEDSQQDSASV